MAASIGLTFSSEGSKEQRSQGDRGYHDPGDLWMLQAGHHEE